jgi:ribosomal protein L3 glutamine methyltransferase
MQPLETDHLITIQDLIRWGTSRFNAAQLYFGHGTDNAFDEASWLVGHALHLPLPLPEQFWRCTVLPSERSTILALFQRRIEERIPAAYLTGSTRFAGLEFVVNQHVMIPRSPLAELIIDQFAPWIDFDHVHRILDLCTGSGCIGLAAAVHLPESTVDLVDDDADALAIAERNLQQLATQYSSLVDRVCLIRSDLFAKLQGRQYDVIMTNPPYVSADEMAHLPAEYRHEPERALAAGSTGLGIALRILCAAADYLTPDGILLMEVGNTSFLLEDLLPEVSFTWIELERGGHGVFLLHQEQLQQDRNLFLNLFNDLAQTSTAVERPMT